MASKALKGLTIKIGGDTSDLLDSLKDVEKKGSDLSKELTQINRLLKLDPKNTELLAQKQKVLAEAIGAAEEKLGKLKDAEKEAQEQFKKGEISEAQYRALQREIIATEGKLNKLKGDAGDTAAALNQLENSAGAAAKDLDDVATEADDAGKELDEAADSAGDMDRASDGLASGGFKALAGAAVAAAGSVVALAESTREYRQQVAMLDTAFETAGFTTEAATKTYEELQSVIGETDQAVEAANHLAKLCDNEAELAAWTEILTGVYGTFGVSLPIENLAEAANETSRTGQVVGGLADALNWATAEGETFGVKMKANTKANEEYNKAVEDAKTAEDFFNIALSECSTQQERQQLITKTLTGLYSKAAGQYKKTNKEVIASNKASEKWAKTTAKMGEKMEPVMTDIKELGVSLLEDLEGPLDSVASFIRSAVIPAVTSISKWVKSNWPTIKGVLVGAATAFVAFKVATAAATIAQAGFKGALMATTVAQKAMNLAMSATPWGFVATAITGVVGAVVSLTSETEKAIEPAYKLTAEEEALAESASKAAESFREQQAATEDALGDATGEMDYVSGLADELLRMADNSGKVKEADEARAQVLVDELNKYLGTEYELTGGIVKNYADLEENIYKVIEAKKAQILLDAYEEQFAESMKNVDQAWDDRKLKQKEYNAQLDRTNAAYDAMMEKEAEYKEDLQKGGFYAPQLAEQLAQLTEDWETEKGLLDEKKAKYDEVDKTYEDYRLTIETFEAASTAAVQGNYDTVSDLLSRKSDAYKEHTAVVDEETAKNLATLEQEAYDAGVHAKLMKKNFEDGVANYTEDMVKEAESGYKTALSKFATAYSDAYGLGENFGQGLADGIKIKNGAVGAAAIAQIREAVKAAKKEAEIKSPSRVARREIGAQWGEGVKLGVVDKTKDIKKAATDQMAATLDAYKAREVNAQRNLVTLGERQAERFAAGQMTAATANAGMLEKILGAIRQGQVLMLDGDTLVGGTANKMDNALGTIRALAARGAL